METNIELSSLLIIATAITTIGGAWLTVRKINKDYKKERAAEYAKILQEAKENDNKLKHTIESKREILYQEITSKIKALETRVDNLEESVAKDFAHVRETYNGELRNLGNKLEELRSELRDQHGNLVQLLSKALDLRD